MRSKTSLFAITSRHPQSILCKMGIIPSVVVIVLTLAMVAIAGCKVTDGGGHSISGLGGGNNGGRGIDVEQPAMSGIPLGGPAVLYSPPPNIPQLQNRDERFQAPFEMVSGTERYVDGEYLYTDFIYDDATTTYPDDPDLSIYANNAADLVEFRVSALGSGLAFRLTLNTLLVLDSTIAVVAFDSDRDESTGSSTLPRDPEMPFPGTDHVLTTWGTGSEWSTWNGTSWETVALETHTDLEANQITITVPRSVADPGGQWLATLATGLYDTVANDWMALGAALPLPLPSTGSKIINLGFRFNEVDIAPPYSMQSAALEARAPTQFANLIDFDLLRSHGARNNVPTHGMMFRIFASRLPSVSIAINDEANEHDGKHFAEGKALNFDPNYLSPLQPYAIYIPSGYNPENPAPLTFALHGIDAEYYWINEANSLVADQLGEERNSIILAPSGRGSAGFYVGDQEYDILEAWNDVARHYALDPKRTSIFGLSMGGYGTYRLGLLYPHLFARVVPYIPAISRGIWIPGVAASGGEKTLSNHWLENARNLPIFHIADSLSEITFYPGQAQQVIGPEAFGFQSLDALGYRYTFWSVVMDHALGVVLHGDFLPAIAAFLGQHEIEPEPFHVTYTRMPSNDLLPERGVVHDRAYWLSRIELRDSDEDLAKGAIDAVSFGFGKSDPSSTQSVSPGVVGILAYLEIRRSWLEPSVVPVENRIQINATNIATVTIDTISAHVDCDVQLDILSDGPIDVRLAGCNE